MELVWMLEKEKGTKIPLFAKMGDEWVNQSCSSFTNDPNITGNG